MGKSSSTPPPPDYTGAANATAQGNLEATRAATEANRINQYTPYGSLEYSRDPNAATPDSGWSQTLNLSPVGQQLLDYDNASKIGLGEQTNQALKRVNWSLEQPFDYGSVQDTQDAAYKAYTDRLDPQWDAAGKAKANELANQGIPVGSEAYDNAMRSFNQGKNDAYSQANLGAINTAPQTYQLAQALRSQPLNELNALRTGAQVQNPTFNQAPQQQTTAGANQLAAAQAQYGAGLDASNANAAANGQTVGAITGLAGAAAVAF